MPDFVQVRKVSQRQSQLMERRILETERMKLQQKQKTRLGTRLCFSTLSHPTFYLQPLQLLTLLNPTPQGSHTARFAGRCKRKGPLAIVTSVLEAEDQ